MASKQHLYAHSKIKKSCQSILDSDKQANLSESSSQIEFFHLGQCGNNVKPPTENNQDLDLPKTQPNTVKHHTYCPSASSEQSKPLISQIKNYQTFYQPVKLSRNYSQTTFSNIPYSQLQQNIKNRSQLRQNLSPNHLHSSPAIELQKGLIRKSMESESKLIQVAEQSEKTINHDIFNAEKHDHIQFRSEGKNKEHLNTQQRQQHLIYSKSYKTYNLSKLQENSKFQTHNKEFDKNAIIQRQLSLQSFNNKNQETKSDDMTSPVMNEHYREKSVNFEQEQGQVSKNSGMMFSKIKQNKIFTSALQTQIFKVPKPVRTHKRQNNEQRDISSSSSKNKYQTSIYGQTSLTNQNESKTETEGIINYQKNNNQEYSDVADQSLFLKHRLVHSQQYSLLVSPKVELENSSQNDIIHSKATVENDEYLNADLPHNNYSSTKDQDNKPRLKFLFFPQLKQPPKLSAYKNSSLLEMNAKKYLQGSISHQISSRNSNNSPSLKRESKEQSFQSKQQFSTQKSKRLEDDKSRRLKFLQLVENKKQNSVSFSMNNSRKSYQTYSKMFMNKMKAEETEFLNKIRSICQQRLNEEKNKQTLQQQDEIRETRNRQVKTAFSNKSGRNSQVRQSQTMKESQEKHNAINMNQIKSSNQEKSKNKSIKSPSPTPQKDSLMFPKHSEQLIERSKSAMSEKSSKHKPHVKLNLIIDDTKTPEPKQIDYQNSQRPPKQLKLKSEVQRISTPEAKKRSSSAQNKIVISNTSFQKVQNEQHPSQTVVKVIELNILKSPQAVSPQPKEEWNKFTQKISDSKKRNIQKAKTVKVISSNYLQHKQFKKTTNLNEDLEQILIQDQKDTRVQSPIKQSQLPQPKVKESITNDPLTPQRAASPKEKIQFLKRPQEKEQEIFPNLKLRQAKSQRIQGLQQNANINGQDFKIKKSISEKKRLVNQDEVDQKAFEQSKSQVLKELGSSTSQSFDGQVKFNILKTHLPTIIETQSNYSNSQHQASLPHEEDAIYFDLDNCINDSPKQNRSISKTNKGLSPSPQENVKLETISLSSDNSESEHEKTKEQIQQDSRQTENISNLKNYNQQLKNMQTLKDHFQPPKSPNKKGAPISEQTLNNDQQNPSSLPSAKSYRIKYKNKFSQKQPTFLEETDDSKLTVYQKILMKHQRHTSQFIRSQTVQQEVQDLSTSNQSCVIVSIINNVQEPPQYEVQEKPLSSQVQQTSENEYYLQACQTQNIFELDNNDMISNESEFNQLMSRQHASGSLINPANSDSHNDQVHLQERKQSFNSYKLLDQNMIRVIL